MNRRQTSSRRCSMAACLLSALLLPAAPAAAQDGPHWAGELTAIDCTSQCHVPHQAAGGNLTQAASNVLLCQSCHRSAPSAAPDLPVDSADMAVPGVGGIHHAFDVAAINAAFGTQEPLDTEMNLRLLDDAGTKKVVCSTCHNQHRAEQAYGGRSRIGTARKTTDLGSSGAVASTGTYTGSVGVWYLIDITGQGSDTTARFRYSKDGGTTWFPDPACAPGNVATCLTADGSNPVALGADGAGVAFSGGGASDFLVGEQWEFSAAWPFLRWAQPTTADALIDTGDNTTGDAFCRDCHRTWVMDDVSAYNSGAVKSHPVGVVVPGTAEYRSGTPLDGHGLAQGGAGDGNPTNDLLFDGTGRVQCLTCHGVHYVDSNTLTVDVP